MQQWFETPPGRYLLAWEQAEFDRSVGDIFGYHALQLGLPELQALQANRMPHRWLALPDAQDAAGPAGAHLVTDFAALPFEENSLDLVVLPHALELNVDPHTTLREVERVLVPEGKVVISCLNPASLWGLRQRRAHPLARNGARIPGEGGVDKDVDALEYRHLVPVGDPPVDEIAAFVFDQHLLAPVIGCPAAPAGPQPELDFPARHVGEEEHVALAHERRTGSDHQQRPPLRPASIPVRLLSSCACRLRNQPWLF